MRLTFSAKPSTPIPNIQLTPTPYRITGPAMVNIFTPIPKTWPRSGIPLREHYGISKAGDGYKAPAPPNFTSFW
mgnify:CR=1 FL=1